MFSKSQYDLIVIGAGPGGCAAAAVAARGGLDVLLLERSMEPAFKVGESLMPETYGTFEKMGALERMRSAGFVEKHSVQFFAKSGKASAPFYFSTVKSGEGARTWQVLRSDFDQLLFEVAEEAGAECRRGVNARELVTEGERVVGVTVDAGGERVELGSKVLIDATGQSALVSRRFDLGRIDYGLQHASIFTHFEGARRDSGIDEGATLVLHTSEGHTWFWFIPLAGDVTSVGVVGRLDALVRGREGTPEEVFFEEVAKCPEIADRLAEASRCRPFAVCKDFSYRCERMAGDGWVLVGDAFSFIDPVYSSGVFLALKSGELAAETAAVAIADGDVSGERLGAFQSELERAISAVHRLVQAFYSRDFSFGEFLRMFPHLQRSVTRILIGDVFDSSYDDLFQAMETFRLERADTVSLSPTELSAGGAA
ncbi:MAG TPA: NAD(P)/FAD-dependent oxidoreductase [Thermoanaerobaculia bacterium]|nr:NAD(P)/FAD-dependent oxidoreductase [Thermoanaerobaculia bacterium]